MWNTNLAVNSGYGSAAVKVLRVERGHFWVETLYRIKQMTLVLGISKNFMGIY